MRGIRIFQNQSGFTMLELLVSLSVVAVLAAIIIPAVQSARGSAHIVACRNNLKQVVIALEQYAAIHRQYPKTRSRTGSSFVSLLPWLDQASLYASIIEASRCGRHPETVQLRVLVCPSDPVAASRRCASSIGENVGICVHEKALGSPRGRKYDGIFLTSMQPDIVRPASVTDGMSNTACYAEIVGYPRPNGGRLIYSHATDGMRCLNVLQLALRCRAAEFANPSGGVLQRGSDWIYGGLQVSQYQHVLPPNERECLFIPSAASEHVGGANTAFCDGSVKFMSSSIDDSVWQATGSRNGAESASDL